MSEGKARRIGVINFIDKIDILAEDIAILVKANAYSVGKHVSIDVTKLANYSIPDAALVEVEIKDNVLNEPKVHSVGTWAEVAPQRKIMVDVGAQFFARRTSVTLMFVDPSNAAFVATSPQMHAVDESGVLQGGGESYIKFEKSADSIIPARAFIDNEGPKVLLGRLGPDSVAECERDEGFVKYGLPSVVSSFAVALLVSDEGFEKRRWEKFRSDAANWAGFDDWNGLKDRFKSETEKNPGVALVEMCDRIVGGMMSSPTFKKMMKAAIAAADHEEIKNAA